MPFGNSLTREVSFKVGPVILDVLVKHYFDRLKSDVAGSNTPLKQDDILYDEAFTIVKVRSYSWSYFSSTLILEIVLFECVYFVSSYVSISLNWRLTLVISSHTIEELQGNHCTEMSLRSVSHA